MYRIDLELKYVTVWLYRNIVTVPVDVMIDIGLSKFDRSAKNNNIYASPVDRHRIVRREPAEIDIKISIFSLFPHLPFLLSHYISTFLLHSDCLILVFFIESFKNKAFTFPRTDWKRKRPAAVTDGLQWRWTSIVDGKRVIQLFICTDDDRIKLRFPDDFPED